MGGGIGCATTRGVIPDCETVLAQLDTELVDGRAQ
jgi:hypothetical protein